MKFVSFEAGGAQRFGLVSGSDVIALDGKGYSSLADALARTSLRELGASAGPGCETFELDGIGLLPVITRPGKIWCCGLNYRDHVAEARREVGAQPTFFLRVADSQVGHGAAMVLPLESSSFDYEGEIAIVIGKGGRRIEEKDALSHVAGYACYNDGSVRDWQRHTSQWAPGKNFWRTGAFGPWLVTTDEIGPQRVLTVVTRVNGAEVQRATSDMMIHSIARQIAYLSRVAPLEPGDVVVTGTPGGVGSARVPPVFLKDGDVVEIDIDPIGVLRNTVVDERRLLDR